MWQKKEVVEDQNVNAKPHQRIVDAFDYFLSGKEQKIVDSVLRDLSPRTEVSIDKEGQEQITTKPPRGLSVGSVFRVIGLVFSHPVHTFSMIRFALNPTKYNTPATHRAILSNENTWKFVQNTGSKLDQVGAVLGNMGIPEFQKGGVLDQKSLVSLKEVFKEPQNLQDMKNIALAARADQVDGLKVARPLLDMLARDQRFKEYFVDKGPHLQAFIIKTVNQQIEQDKKRIINQNGDLSESIEAKMASIGLSPKDIEPLTDIVPILISKPKVLKEVVDHLAEGQYPAMVKKLLSTVEDTPEINQYLKDNQALFVGVLDQVIKQVPELEGYNLKGDLYDIVPALLDHPDALIEIIECQEKFQFEKAGQVFFDLVKTDERFKSFFAKNQKIFAGAALKAAGLETYEIGNEVGEIFSHLMNERNAPKIQKLMDRFHNEEWLDLAKDLCNMIEQDPEFKQYVVSNKKNFSKIVKVVLDKLPEVRELTGGTKVSKLAGLIITDPASARELIEGIEQGKFMGAYAVAKFAWNKAFDPEIRSALSETVMGWFAGRNESQQEVVTGITEMLSSRDPEERVNLTDFIQASYNEMSKDVEIDQRQKLQKQILRKKFFEKADIVGERFDKINMSNLEVTGNQFVNTKFEHVNFENSSFTNASFHGAKFNDVRFTGTEIE